MRALDLTDQRFGEFTAKYPEVRSKKRGWVCLCSCGNVRWIPTYQLTSGNNKTCGDSIHKQSIKIGDRFGKLTVTKISRGLDERFIAECTCDCGEDGYVVSFKNLQRGVTKHCGCFVDNSNRGLPEGESQLNSLISSYKCNAKNRGLDFTLTKEDCVRLFSGNCYFCGQPPSAVFKKKKLKGTYIYSGIDRVDSKEGYSKENTVSCCMKCNFLKGNKSNEEFLEHIRKIYEHQEKNNQEVLST